MASTGRRRVNSNSDRTENYIYVDGSTARKVQVRKDAEPHRTPGRSRNRMERPAERRESDRRRRTEPDVASQQQLEKNRANARSMGVGYVLFLSASCLLTMFLCVQYLNLKSTLTTQIDTIEIMESELNSMKADNDAYYNQVQSSVTLEDIKNAALSFGMHYATESQIEYYSIDESSYMRQYQDVPE